MKHKNLQNRTGLKTLLVSSLFLLVINASHAQSIPADSLYFGQTPPGSTPEIFAPKISMNACAFTFTPDGTQVFFDTVAWPHRVIKQMEYKNNKWTGPTIASFSLNQYPGEPSLSPDGKRIFFYGFPNISNTSNTDIYYCEKDGTAWGNPKTLGNAMTTSAWEFHPCILNDSSIYFANGNGEICKSQYKNGTYQAQVKMSYPLNYANTSTVYADAYVNPNEDYMIFRSNRIGGFGKQDLYISYKNTDTTWTNPKNLGNKINTNADEGEGDITPDGKYMTFRKGVGFYWVSSSFIDSLKHTNFAPYVKTAIPNLIDTAGKTLLYTIPSTTFVDDDGNNTLTYSATLSDGNPLPSWLKFNPETKTFSNPLTEAGIFKIKVIATDTAKTSISCIFSLNVVDKPVSINHINAENIQIYPNPASGQVTISFGTILSEKALVEITNMEGRLIVSSSFNNTTNASIDLSNLPKGLYLVHLILDNERINKLICLE